MKQVLTQARYAFWALFNREKLQPTFKINNFNELVVPASVRLVILDKDNCFTKPHISSVYHAYQDRWVRLLESQNGGAEVVVLSNSAGDLTVDKTGKLADDLQSVLQVPVLKHSLRKPLCYQQIRARYSHLKDSEILVVGDRLLTDILMANLMGVQSVWVNPGLHPGWGNRLDSLVAKLLRI